MKNKLVLFITGCFAFVMSSCLKTDEIADVELIKNCQISSFSLSSDSVKGLANVKFTIDQLTGEIFNIDSMPYGTKVENVLCTVKYASTYAISGVEVSPNAFPDSTYYWNSTDSINFSKSVRFVVHAYDKLTSKVYKAQINIHQVKQDSMIWVKYADPMIGISMREREQKVVPFNYQGDESYFMFVKPMEAGKPYQLYKTAVAEPKDWELLPLSGLPADGLHIRQLSEFEGALYVPATDGTLYTSKDGLEWTAVENAPFVKYVLGGVKGGSRQLPALATVIEKDGVLTFCAMDKSNAWSEGAAVQPGFPVTGFGNIQYSAMYYEYLMVAGGRDKDNQLTNTSWATSDGKKWAVMGSQTQSGFGLREGTMLANYDKKFFMIGGLDASGHALKDIHLSIDNGITWSRVDTMVVLPPSFQSRAFSSVVVDKENFVNLFGGVTSPGKEDLDQLWRGRIYRLVPKDE